MASSARIILVLLASALMATAQCTPPLNPVEDQHFVDPPTITQGLVGIHGDIIEANITLRQTIPPRFNVSAAFINPTTLALTPYSAAMAEGPCDFRGVFLASLSDLIRDAHPIIEVTATQYAMRFSISVQWFETFPLAGVNYTRSMQAILSFEVDLMRDQPHRRL
eukprot:m51a1_g13141 hypothetical protein (165) ;mRNA; r:381-1286